MMANRWMRGTAVVLPLLALGAANGCSGSTPGGGGSSNGGSSGTSSGLLPGGSSGGSSGGGSSGSSSGGSSGGSSGSSSGASACPDGRPVCGANCCDSGSTCVDDGTGNTVCAQQCSASKQCPSAKGCCTVLQDTATTGIGACMTYGTANGQACMCTAGTDCTSGTCGLFTDTNNLPLPVFICVANDGAAYDGCNGSSCSAGLCCLKASAGSTTLGDLCEKGCQNDSECDSSSHCQPLTSGNCSGLLGSCVPR